ncbi:PSP1 domain-containing protein [Plebeiibacterium sediminum]|uniref:Regulatory iron-sulfur-containing complex subunit RicT n=1 Tax=Plebeiibacterium sediminum TaxID=2992112 RepID=A0AAE3SF47_9BACT|nr:regulatory iron-sulfur-containing complex subunit RicT [Plebeiobacterium sediminum]MCW3785793.1 regulatory iron-sulfur-containing complex subunit RicT [Plebeiobacterium sediminum]
MEEEVQSKCSTCIDRCGKLDVYDWLADVPESCNVSDIVEIQFKNTRKSYYKNTNGLRLKKGDVVAVEASPGHDIGTVSCTGEIAVMQMRKNRLNINEYEFKRVYRHAKPVDYEKWEEAKELEHETMIKSRQISADLNLNMKIGDVEYQGDRTKAIFYYIADERVDFRQLIKVLADKFKVRIEMRQIGARQEAGRIGGIGPCGRELCCSSWITNFVSVTTNAARYQEISLNPQKLAGQCGKLKCCLNFELDAYIDAQKGFPKTDIPLETQDNTYYHFKTDIFKGIMSYSTDKMIPANITEVPVDRVKEIIRMNKRGKKVPSLLDDRHVVVDKTKALDYQNVVGEDSISRFDEPKKPVSRNRNKRRRKPNTNNNNNNRNPKNKK